MKYSRPSLVIEDVLIYSLGIDDNLIEIVWVEEQSNIFLRNSWQFNRDSLSWKIF